MMFRRLMIVAFVFSFTSFLLHMYNFYLMFVFPIVPPEKSEAWMKKRVTFSLLRTFYQYVELPLYFGLIYLLCTPTDLYKEYRRIIGTILAFDLIGGVASSIIGIIVTGSMEYIQANNKVEYIKLAMISVSSSLAMHPIYSVFKGFTACTLSFIRRKRLSPKNLSY